MKRKGTKKRKSVLGIIVALILMILLLWISRTNGFFVQFKNEGDVGSFLRGNLPEDISSANEVQQFMEGHTGRFERCGFRNLSDLPATPNIDNLSTNYDNAYLQCEVFSQNKFIFDPVTQWYIISFYFDAEKLAEIDVIDYFLGP